MDNTILKPSRSLEKVGIFGKIKNQENALTVIKDASNTFYFLAAIQIILGYFIMGVEVIIDGVIFAVFAFLLRKFNSRVVAVILLLLSIAGLVITGINKFGSGTGGQNLFLAVIMVWVSVRSIQATFGLKKFQQA